MLRPSETHLHLAIDKRPEITGIVSVPDVQVMRWHIQHLVSEAEKLQLSQPNLQSVPPVWHDLHGNIQCRRDLCWLPSLQWQRDTACPCASVHYQCFCISQAVLRSFTLNSVTGCLTHCLLAIVCFGTLRNVVAGSSFQFSQGFQQFLLLPKQKRASSTWLLLLSIISDHHLFCYGG